VHRANDALSPNHRAVIYALCESLPLDTVNWALTGSAGHSLQGVPISVHDVDVQTDEPGAWVVADRLVAHVVEPLKRTESAVIRSLFGRFDVGGVIVEVMGAVQKRQRDGSWGAPTDPSRHRRLVQLDGLQVPVLSLEYEAAAYAQLGRHERATLLRNWLHEEG
jgi:hypothetical protein